MKRHFIAALTILALPSLSSQVEAGAETSSGVHPKSLVGCWTRRIKEPDAQNRWPRIVSYCLKSNGEIYGFAYDTGDGWDFPGRWQVKEDKLVLGFDEENYACNFSISEVRDSLTMTDCYTAGVYKFNKDADADASPKLSED